LTFKVVVSDKGNSYQFETEDSVNRKFIGLAIGDTFDGNLIGKEVEDKKVSLDGFTLKITGGSDKNGFPMKKDIDGPRRIRSLVSGGVGYKPKADGVKRRKTFRGNTISDDIVQINTIVSESGNKTIEQILNPPEEEEVPEEVEETPVEEVEAQAAEEATEEEPEASEEETEEAPEEAEEEAVEEPEAEEDAEEEAEEEPSEEEPEAEEEDKDE
jgi:small subunit ribosomal protein S6e